LENKEEVEPNLAKYYPVSSELGLNDFSDITLKNISLAFILLGLIGFMVNALMVFLFMSQTWVVIWPQTSAAEVGAILMVFGGMLYFVDFLIERRSKVK
jgi:hypothetical protein